MITNNLLGDFFHRMNAGAIEIVVKLAGLDEQMVLDVLFHLFSCRHKVVVSAVHLVFTTRPRCI